jgi:hypothetical protein
MFEDEDEDEDEDESSAFRPQPMLLTRAADTCRIKF